MIKSGELDFPVVGQAQQLLQMETPPDSVQATALLGGVTGRTVRWQRAVASQVQKAGRGWP